MVNTWRLHHPERVRIQKVPLPGELLGLPKVCSETSCGQVFIGLLDIFRISVSSSHLEGTLRRFSWAQLQCFGLRINWWLSNYFTNNPIPCLLESASWTTNRSAFARCYGHENRLFRTKATDLRAGTQCCGHWGELNFELSIFAQKCVSGRSQANRLTTSWEKQCDSKLISKILSLKKAAWQSWPILSTTSNCEGYTLGWWTYGTVDRKNPCRTGPTTWWSCESAARTVLRMIKGLESRTPDVERSSWQIKLHAFFEFDRSMAGQPTPPNVPPPQK